MKKYVKKLGTFAMVLIIAGSIDNIRNLAGTAQGGSYIPFFFVIGSIFFLIPAALVSAYFGANFTRKGEEGIYGWMKSVFNAEIGLFALSCQYLQTLTWYPAVLAFIAGMIGSLTGWNHITILEIAIFWAITYINIRGLATSFKLMKIFIFVGMVLPMAFIMIFGIIFLLQGNHTYVHFTMDNMIPPLDHLGAWTPLMFAVTGFTGIELAMVHVRNVVNPQKTFPKALAYASTFMLITMVLGALAIWSLTPSGKIDAEFGVAGAFRQYLDHFGIGWAYPIALLMIIAGTLGQLTNWILSPIRGIAYTRNDGFLPHSLCKLNKNGTPGKLLIIQACIITAVCLIFSFLPANSFMTILTSTGTQVYISGYIVMFIAILKDNKRAIFKIKSPKLLAILGLIGCILTIIVGLAKPDSVSEQSLPMNYQLMYVSIWIISYVPLAYCYWYKHRRKTIKQGEIYDKISYYR